MKAFHFAKPFEFRLEIPNDQVTQGSLLQGTLIAVNRDTARREGLRLELGLAAGDFKKVKEQGVAAMELLERHNLAEGFALEPGKEQRVPWQMALRLDCPVTTKEGGLFLLYGANLDDQGARGVIDLPVALAPPLESFITTLENHFAFEARTRRFGEGFTHVKFKPPARYPTLEEVIVAMRIGEDGLHLRFDCKRKGLGRGVKSGIRTNRVELERQFPTREFLLNSGQPNRELFRTVIQEVLAEVTPTMLQAEPAT